jgi:hypothetical protein
MTIWRGFNVMSTTGTGARIVVGSDINVFRAMTLKSALNLYAKTGMMVNRAYNPKSMMRTAEIITGKKFKARDYAGAAAAQALIDGSR